MNDRTDLDKIREELKKSSENIFKKKPKEIEEELRKERTMGSPDNLIDRDEDEEKDD